MAQPGEKKRKFSKLICPHCCKRVSKSTWYRHYSEFCSTGVWMEEVSNETDFTFGSSDESSDPDMPGIMEPDNSDSEMVS